MPDLDTAFAECTRLKTILDGYRAEDLSYAHVMEQYREDAEALRDALLEAVEAADELTVQGFAPMCPADAYYNEMVSKALMGETG